MYTNKTLREHLDPDSKHEMLAVGVFIKLLCSDGTASFAYHKSLLHFYSNPFLKPIVFKLFKRLTVLGLMLPGIQASAAVTAKHIYIADQQKV